MSAAFRFHPIVELTKARLREFWREPGMLFWVFAFPLLMAIGLGLAFRSRPPDLPKVAVVAEEHSPAVRALLSSNRVVARELEENAARRELSHAKVDVLVKPNADKTLYVYDKTRDEGARARLVVDDVLQRAAGRRDELRVADETAALPGSRYIDFLIPGLIALNVMGSSIWGVGYSLVVGRKRRLLRRYAVTPMRRSHFLLSYFFSRSFFLIVELGVLLTFAAVAFDTVVRGSYVAFFLMALLGAASFAGLSLLVGARVENTESANGWMNLIQLPMWVLSGPFFAYERFPEWMHIPIRLLPLTALCDALRGISNDAMSLVGLLPQVAVLAVWGALGFGVALKTFRWQ